MYKTSYSLLAIVISVIMTFIYPMDSIQLEAETIQQINNLVLFAQFESSSESNFMEPYTDTIVSMCNSIDDTTGCKSLKSYIRSISYGQADTQCYFPQLKDGTIVPYQLKQSKEEYLNSELLAYEVLNNIEVSNDIPLDGNNDGVIDNIILIVDGKPLSGDDLLWPCAFYLNGLTINGKYTGYINIQNSYSLFGSLVSGGVGVLCHEFLHSLEYPDLYRNSSREGTSVGLWDVMCSNSIFLQYPLAYQRATISNWLEPTQITKDGSYTINSVSQDSGDRLYILKTPFSDTELFAIEYRVQGNSYTYELDSKVYGTGLVIYRIDTEVDGNHKTDKDQIYVFRPDETSVDSGQGDIYHSYYGGSDCPNEIGSLNFEDGITENALVYSDGSNSGIKISNIVLNGNEATFDVQFADTSNSNLWETAYSSSEKITSLDLDSSNGIPYMLTSNGRYANVSYLQDGSWVQLGDSIGSGTYSSVNNAKIVMCNNNPYVLFNDYDFNIKLYGYNSLDDSWELKYISDTSSQYTDVTSNGDSIYIAYTIGSYPYELNVLKYDTSTESIEYIGDSLSSNVCNISMACNGKDVIIAYRDLDDNSLPKVTIYDGTTFKTIELSSSSCSTVSTATNGSSFIVATTGDDCNLYEISDSYTTTMLSLPTDIEGSIFDIVPLVNNGNIYLAINTQKDDDFSVYCLYDDSWSKVGNSLSKEIVNFPNLLLTDDTLYVGYTSSSGNLTLKTYTVSVQDSTPQDPSTVGDSNILGDINFDGNIDYLDILILKKHILGITCLTQKQYTIADIYSDNAINVLDVISLKNSMF